MKQFCISLLALQFSLSLIASNPIVKGKGYGDPHIKIFNDTVYIYVSHDIDPYAGTFVMQDWYVLTSTDMVNWKDKCVLKAENTYVGKNDNCWALDVAKRNDKYYLYFSEWSKQTGVAICNTPNGVFIDALNGPLLPDTLTPTREYDPAIFIDNDKDQSPYIVFGGPKWAYGDSADDYYIAKLNDDMISLAEKPRKIHVNNEADDKPYLHKHNGLYYLSWASHYAISPNVYGPYEYKGNIKASLDHGSFAQWNNQWFNAFTIFDPSPFHRATGLTYIHYKKDGTIAQADSLILKYGVGQYEATWDKIEAEWYMSANDGSIKEEFKENEFGVYNETQQMKLKYPNIHNMNKDTKLYLKLKARQSGKIIVSDFKTKKILATTTIPESNDWQTITMSLQNPEGDNNILIQTTPKILIDNFSFNIKHNDAKF